MKRIIALLVLILSILSINAANLSFSGGKSSLSLREGREEVTLSEGAVVNLDDMTISGDTIILSGEDWRYVRCEGNTVISDQSRGLEIRAIDIMYDRINEYLSIGSWFEINDTKEEISAMGGSMFFDMEAETLELNQQVTLFKLTDRGIMECTAESMIYNRNEETLSLRSGASVKWAGDEYKAEVISVNLSNDSIKLEGRIQGSING